MYARKEIRLHYGVSENHFRFVLKKNGVFEQLKNKKLLTEPEARLVHKCFGG